MKTLFIGGGIIVLGFFILGALNNQRIEDSYNPPQEKAKEVFLADCGGASSGCAKISVQGDPPFSAGKLVAWGGYADPSIRKDPGSNRLWLAYSWPHIKNLQPVVSTHVASSADRGRTWVFEQSLWESERAVNPVDGKPGYMNNEVPNILAAQTKEGVVWYGARQQYFVPDDGNLANRPLHSSRTLISRADSPQGLATAPAAVLAGAKTEDAWGKNTRLSKLSPEVGYCDQFTEPGLFFRGETLYLSLACVDFGLFEWRAFTEVFATTPEGPPADWTWRYVGNLADKAVAQELGANSVIQADLAEGQDGQVLAIFTPADFPTGPKNFQSDIQHYSCRAAEVASLEPFRLARDANGNLKIRAVIASSNSVEKGNGACAYDPASATGVLIVRRAAFSPGNVVVELFATGLHP